MPEESSDPLPYTQLDRAVKAPAARLAQRLKVTYQHALGGLAEFWELCGDPRDLEKLLDEGKREVLLSREEIVRRFTNGMGVDCSAVTPDDLVALRLLERRGDEYRVRGMSRYFKVIEGRRIKREAGAAGGKKSAETRAARYGTAQPRSASASESASAGASGGAPQPTLFPEADAEAAPKHGRTQRTADSGQLQDRSDRSKPPRELTADEVWGELVGVFESFDLPPPEIHPAQRNDRLKTLKGQLPKDWLEHEPKLLPQVMFAAIDRFPAIRSAEKPLGYLQKLLKEPDSRKAILDRVAALRDQEPAA